MNRIWVLTIKTSLPKTCYSTAVLKTTVMAFDAYEKARTAFRKKVRAWAFTNNAMFNKKGQIKFLDHFISECTISEAEPGESEAEDDDEKYLYKERLMQLQNALSEAFAGNDTKLGLPNGYYTNACDLSLWIKSGSIRLYGDFEGPFNGIEPVIYTNIFSMAKEKNYYLYINDAFGQEENSAELYMDLTQAEVH